MLEQMVGFQIVLGQILKHFKHKGREVRILRGTFLTEGISTRQENARALCDGVESVGYRC